ncbi:MAG: FmdB family zinc ribbon protein [Anaerolineales bacterium]
MPTYTYQCDNCGVRFDRHQKFSEKLLSVCPECSKKSLRKVFTPVGIVFKGSGFYATDHRSPSGGSRKNGSTKEEGEGETKSKSESEGTEKKDSKKLSEKKTD